MYETCVEIKVTMEVSFLVPMYSDHISKINGWTLHEVAKDWFTDINRYHASRDCHQIGGSKVVKEITWINPADRSANQSLAKRLRIRREPYWRDGGGWHCEDRVTTHKYFGESPEIVWDMAIARINSLGKK